MPTPNKVLILSARAPVALEWARHFQAAQWQVTLADYGAGQLSRHSAIASDFFTLPPPASEPLAFVLALLEIIKQHHINWLLPTCEEIFYIAHYQHLFPADCHIWCADFDTLQRLHNKWQFSQLAPSMGMSVPATELLSTAGQQFGCDSIIKPVYSRFGHQAQVLPAHTALPKCIPSDGSWLRQELLRGQELCSYSIAVTGRLLAHVTYWGKYRYRQGASFYFQPVPQARIHEQVQKLVGALNFTGQIAFDWMVSADGSQIHALECNPRATSGVHLFAADGSLVEAMHTQTSISPHAQAKMVAAMMLTSGLKQALSSRQLPLWWRDYQQARDVLGSPAVYWGCLQDAYHFYRVAQEQHLPLEAVSSLAFEWNGHALPTMPALQDA